MTYAISTHGQKLATAKVARAIKNGATLEQSVALTRQTLGDDDRYYRTFQDRSALFDIRRKSDPVLRLAERDWNLAVKTPARARVKPSVDTLRRRLSQLEELAPEVISVVSSALLVSRGLPPLPLAFARRQRRR